jgi:hypothetical protein
LPLAPVVASVVAPPVVEEVTPLLPSVVPDQEEPSKTTPADAFEMPASIAAAATALNNFSLIDLPLFGRPKKRRLT